ncbi:L-ascorbate metabolism protein UlaG, beta-lactamase superfamily [Halovenus aranensis]|uniref:L-ascorbate metabolism protein UlaG, beta-lactamase superfamily n=1 Tax=Halovenus aranensis TaxID=890420 RepID=A0A1G8UXT2_9EURY|nr:MBL fold metallo-hydrolase [Halovenus aranensis]SDJ58613.1 L-ascorbate metabolism protein UlaG, beta-lactamase superfamily [Halovenus aranensis]
MTVSHGDLTVDWYGNATVRLDADGRVVYLDPGRYGVLTGEWTADSEDAADAHPSGQAHRPADADLVCLSHVHHYDPDGIERVATDDTTVAAFEGMNIRSSSRDLPRLSELPYDVVELGTEDEAVLADLPVWTVPAYNEPDGPRTRPDGTPFHPKGRGCGFLLSVGGTRVFWPGDTDVLEGHEQLDVDVFLPPIGGGLTMDRAEAADLAAALEPDLVVPIHYNTFETIEADSRAFATDVATRGVPVALDEQP